MKINARKMALKILNHIELEHVFSHHALNHFFETYEVSNIDRRFISNLILGVLEHKMLIDFYIRKFSKVRFGKINHEVVNILRLGIYQIMFMDKVPESAAVNESVKLAKRISPAQGNYVNGVLRAFIRAYEEVPLPDERRHPDEYLSIKYSHPKWLVNLWLDAYGYDDTKALLAANNMTPPLSIRVNRLKTTRDDFLKVLDAAGIVATPSKLNPDGILIQSVNQMNITSLPRFKEGDFQIQDISSMMIGHIADVKPGDFVMDVCAAPGGKSCHMAERMHNSGRLLARDVSEQKCQLIADNASRLGISIIETAIFDARHFDKSLRQSADVVLVDAPCSGLGIIRRKPDIKYNKQPEDLASLTRIQREILNAAAEYVKVDGILIYSTCTLNEAENDGQVNDFLAHHDSFERVSLAGIIPGQSETLTLLPHQHQTDGFYIAKMKRIK
ncbi:16S rRNA (cytosine(967)-C(5))-methyltransferase RsmB [Fusibacter paucivorans]|uniref:16S rRNA (cytosine(967)-C(5))-methyltransferase n=1 Tax=Fusibacter paucivorans TaxID=76009 RepID=A0ABS5PSR4_9FIRM|nr:16S rRNA (cytosine(967)-C(5))-methyltransferase RsmB [Fusibacter paucivorans]MBS7527434.1 16S rRNA (cytosine(967)-C(5))-methyltransferase RsmB [Fusibacter paucivorans]